MEVVALVGPSGTGKSHRAQLVAYDLGADAVIDDGLLVREGKILAGKSAKREETRMAAIRRAIFADPDHAAEVRAALDQVQPERLLILGTSEKMVRRIASALRLDAPVRVIPIEAVASPVEIRRARRVRQQEGKHVVPAPTFDVRRTFSGYLVDPLRLWLRSRTERARDMVIEKSVVRPTFSSLGRFTIADTVVSSIAARACLQVEGISRVFRVSVEITREGVAINLDVAVRYGVQIESVLVEAQRAVKAVVEYMTALFVMTVNVHARKVTVGSVPPA